MDLESECSSLKSTQDHQLEPGKVSPDHHNGIRDNGSCAKEEVHRLGSPVNLGDNWPKDADSPPQPANSNPSKSKSPGGVSPVTTKGFGLKKWRRIRRGFVKDSVATVVDNDTSKILKRVLPSNANPTTKTQHSGLDINVGAVDGFTIRGSGSDSRNAVGSVFAAGMDSENSEDRSSKSSTAASAPKARYDQPAVIGHVRERNKAKGLSAKSFGNSSSQRVMQGKGAKIDSSKKARGERVKIEKENSYSSIESDSRSSNVFFTQSTNVTSNGKHTGRRSAGYDDENSDEAHESEQQFSEEVQTGYNKENAGDVEDSQGDSAVEVSWGIKEESSTNRDPLVDSMLSLQSVQEALEKEVQKLGQIGKEPIASFDKMDSSSVPADLTDAGTQELNQSNQIGSNKTSPTAMNSLQTKVLNLEENVKILENELDEARTLLVVKESKVAELEATVSSRKSPEKELVSAVELEEKTYREMESELESLFKQRIEAEIEHLAIAKAMQSLKGIARKQATILKEQESVAEEQARVLNKLGDVEKKAANIKKEAEELEKYHDDILETEELLVTQRGVYKVTWCFCIQLIMLVLVLWFFVLQLSPNPEEVVPT